VRHWRDTAKIRPPMVVVNRSCELLRTRGSPSEEHRAVQPQTPADRDNRQGAPGGPSSQGRRALTAGPSGVDSVDRGTPIRLQILPTIPAREPRRPSVGSSETSQSEAYAESEREPCSILDVAFSLCTSLQLVHQGEDGWMGSAAGSDLSDDIDRRGVSDPGVADGTRKGVQRGGRSRPAHLRCCARPGGIGGEERATVDRR
jgi:hypothetical protein